MKSLIIAVLVILFSIQSTCGTCSSSLAGGQAQGIKTTSKKSTTVNLFVDSQISSGDGLSWKSAFQTIQEAINAIKFKRVSPSKNYTILVAKGTYKVGGKGNVQMGNHMVFPFVKIDDSKHEIRIIGGLDGESLQSFDRESRSELDGNGEMGVHLKLGNNSVTFENFIFKNFVNPYEQGGAIFATNGSVELKNIQFINNKAREGGAVAVYNSKIKFNGCKFEQNRATCNFADDSESSDIGKGGAVSLRYYYYCGAEVAKFENCSFIENRGEGRAVHVCGSSEEIRLTACDFSEPKNLQLVTEDSAPLSIEQ